MILQGRVAIVTRAGSGIGQAAAMVAQIEANMRGKVPIGRWASVDGIAEVVLFLVSDRSSHMTGQILVIGGGETVV